VVLMQGEAILQFEGRPDLHLHAGDYCTIPAHQRHRVAWTTPDQPTVWLAVFF
jgi:cupin 2 domain-containing protein